MGCNRVFHILSIYLLFFAPYGVRAQKFETLGGSVQEKIYIHYDKAQYHPGETIWFKAYLYANRLPSRHSSDFYIQLLHPSGRILQQYRFPVLGTTVTGSTDLPDSIRTGVCLVR